MRHVSHDEFSELNGLSFYVGKLLLSAAAYLFRVYKHVIFSDILKQPSKKKSKKRFISIYIPVINRITREASCRLKYSYKHNRSCR
jgi:hypothetical protein